MQALLAQLVEPLDAVIGENVEDYYPHLHYPLVIWAGCCKQIKNYLNQKGTMYEHFILKQITMRATRLSKASVRKSENTGAKKNLFLC